MRQNFFGGKINYKVDYCQQSISKSVANQKKKKKNQAGNFEGKKFSIQFTNDCKNRLLLATNKELITNYDRFQQLMQIIANFYN